MIHIKKLKPIAVFLALGFIAPQAMTQEPTRYMTPPAELAEIINAPATPSFRISPTREYALLAEPQDMPDLSELAQPELKLAGVRINPNNFGESRNRFYTNISVRKLTDKEAVPVTNLPKNGLINDINWAPNGKRVALQIYLPETIELWVVDVTTAKAERWATKLNTVLVGSAFEWLPNSESIVYCAVAENLPVIPSKQELPLGPSVQESKGKSTKVRTYQDMLKDVDDEQRFDYYTKVQLYLTSNGNTPVALGNPGQVQSFSVSPNGEYLLVDQILRPYSYIVPYYRFPRLVEIWNMEGKVIKHLAELPLTEDLPQGFSATTTGPRGFSWRNDEPATIYWIEAQDKGDPKVMAEIRDKLFMLKEPFKGTPTEFASLRYRYAGIQWGWSEFAVIYERWWETRTVATSFINPAKTEQPAQLIWERSWQDAYADPGMFVTEQNEFGKSVLLRSPKGDKLYLYGEGASPEGVFPFLDEFDYTSKKAVRIWRCEAPYYERFVAFTDVAKGQIITSKESLTEQPNYFTRDIKRKKSTQITFFPHPYPSLKDVQKEQIRYKRSDGVELTGTLYLPAGYKKGSKLLPVLMWAYPEEFVNAELAGQITESKFRFIRPGKLSPIMWVTRGYAVLDDLGMPIVGSEGVEPNDTFIEQLVDNAKAAIDALANMKVGDPNRVAIGGHSYGAFMTANLLAHSNLFAAGIARSGAYNRTLTPFGFQSEERTFWQSPDIYMKMSPFAHADKLKTPILFIHGEADNNSGTFTMQSERMFTAVKGHGGTARLVLLPYESHGYRARQSILHTAWETDMWLEKYVKGKK